MTAAPFIAPYSDAGYVVHRIAGHASGIYLRGVWNTLCGRTAEGITTSWYSPEEGERECRQCHARAVRIGLVEEDA